jgi:hypothetical protein
MADANFRIDPLEHARLVPICEEICRRPEMVFLLHSPNAAASDGWKAAGQQLLALARLPFSAAALGIAVHLLAMPGAVIRGLAYQSVPLPVLAYVVMVTLYLFGALVLFAGYRIGTVAALLGTLTLAVVALHFV